MALTIAGSDPGGGAGIQADLKTFHALGAFGVAAITALTAQNTRGVSGVEEVSAAFVRAQVDAVLGDLGCAAAKTGMLASAAIVEAVANALREHRVERYVCDPVMVAKGGARLLLPEAEAALRERLLPLALLVTPNADEVRVLTGRLPHTRADMEEAARVLVGMGARAALVKGGHIEAEPGVALDVLFDGERFVDLRAPRLSDAPTHGAGCTLSAAITASLAHGLPLVEAVEAGHRFLSRALARGGIPGRGAGHGCPDHRAGA